ncbi:MAG: ATP-binding cassette domain-containing protein [Proteobacteria bacterium]|nr:ATP-binding cassette domain-containing protein [Pseudomonadota bacterium]
MNNYSVMFKNISLGYHADTPVLTDLNFSIPNNAYCAIVGANGAGKSTLLKLIAGLIKPTQGRIKHPFKRLAYLSQNGNFNRTFPISVADVLKMGKFVYADSDYNNKALRAALDTVKLVIPLDCPIGNLSGGQFQRILFARILLQNPDLLLLDEPFNGIDEETILDLAEILANLHKQGKTILIAIHDCKFVNNFVPLIIDVKNGKASLRHNQNLNNLKGVQV